MQIEVETLTEAGEAFAHAYAPDELVLDEEGLRLTAPAEVAGRASRKGQEIRLRGRVGTEVEALCDRCLRPVSVPLAAEFDARYVPLGAAEAVELQADDLDFSVYAGETLSVDELVREQILLALPTRLLCREDCKGLCPDCGAELNTGPCNCAQKEMDPRWAALAEMKNRES